MIEILIVIGIIGILSVIGMDGFFFSQKKARDAARKSDLSNISKALELYFHDHEAYPLSFAGDILGCGVSGTSACTWNGSSPFSAGTTVYMPRLPSDPNSNSNMRYYYTSTGISYGLYALLENTSDQFVRVAGWTSTDCVAGAGSVVCNYYVSEKGVERP